MMCNGCHNYFVHTASCLQRNQYTHSELGLFQYNSNWSPVVLTSPSHPAARALIADWFEKSFIIVVCEKMIFNVC